MKSLTDLFIERPVLSGVVSILIFLLGLRSIDSLELRQYPKTEDTVITVTPLKVLLQLLFSKLSRKPLESTT